MASEFITRTGDGEYQVIFKTDDKKHYRIVEDLCRECAEMLKSPMKVCGKCKHFIGGGDWNLCCDLMYDLCYARTKACYKYEEGETP